MKTILFFALLSVVSQSFADNTLKQRLVCVIDPESHCARIPNSAFSHVNRVGDTCIFKFKANVYDSKIELEMTVRTEDRGLNFKGSGPQVNAILPFRDVSTTYPRMLNFGPRDKSFTLRLTDNFTYPRSQPELNPFIYFRTPETSRDSYGYQFWCGEVNEKGESIKNYHLPDAD